ncbi:unnamed protein product [Hymenolepis diminuta]|uniref:Uncharacterized protein n=1 Tax=Hymenolepis diminuta TaxID=6216 RepID=A0A564YQD6_HYMDI|nr:unnamed protein product [Hymenolepis diminuta]
MTLCVILSTKAKHNSLEIARFPKVATSYLCKIREALLNENNEDELAAMRKRKQHCQHSDDAFRTPEFVRNANGMMDENRGKPIRDIVPMIKSESPRVNANAYVETLQNIVIKLSWIDSVANVF